MTQKIRKAPEGAQSPCYELGNGGTQDLMAAN
jgi:hypothetical protein